MVIGEGVAEGVIPFILYHILYYMYMSILCYAI